jgi:sulfatase modifying factor 1
MLAKGSDEGLKTLAEKELSKPSEAVAQAALGEGWAAQAGRESGKYKATATARAAEWIEKAIPDLTGLVKVSAQKTLASLRPAGGFKGPLALDLGGGVRLELVYIKPGIFTMGGTDAPKHSWQRDEKPEHPVTLTKGFYIGKHEVTRGQFAAFVKATGHKTDAEKEGKAYSYDKGWKEIAGVNWQNPKPFTQTDDHPAMCVSWNDAKAFCEWAAKKTGRGVRLPTEAEWEYACRGGTKTRWHFGDTEGALGDHAWMNANSGMQTHPVGRKKQNPWGLYDMYGNVWEWCEDWEGPYLAGAVTDPTGGASGKARCLRGGSWDHDPTDCRSAFRISAPASYRCTPHGYRVASR